MNDLAQALKADRLEAYARVRGGFPLPLAGAIYWGALGVAGHYLPLATWLSIAFYASGAIFPLGLLLSWILRSPFMKTRSAAQSVLTPALIGMLLFWPMAIATMWAAPTVTPLILAIGMSMHWPVIGWSYGRTILFSAHALIRAVLVFAIWVTHGDQSTTLLPFAVSAVYLATVVLILIDTTLLRQRLKPALA